jgi:Icc-related predicted phosphoesterase
MQKAIENSGSYWKIVSEEEQDEFQRDAELRGRFLLQATKDRLDRWLFMAEQRLKPKGIRFLLVFGNDDEWELDGLVKSHPYVESLEEGSLVLFDRHEVIGESGGNLTPFGCPRDMPEDQLLARMLARCQTLRDPGHAIFVLHVPPYDSGIDTAAKLNERLVPVTAGGTVVMVPVGSTAVKQVIEQYGPLLGLHGHIHESPGFRMIGRTLCCNPGSEYSGGILRSILLVLDQDKVISHTPVTR